MKLAILFLSPVFLLGSLQSHPAHQPEEAAAKALASSAQAFLSKLDAGQREPALLPFSDTARFDWHFFPKWNRKGLSLGEMTEAQQTAYWAFLGAVLSESGTAKVKGVIGAEAILWEQSNRSDSRDPKKYFAVFFGEPSQGGDWGASFEGHHLSINLTVVDGSHVYVTPSFFGANPDETADGARPLAGEFDRGLALLKSFDAGQRKLAIGEKMPREILTGARERVAPMAFQGLPAAGMTEAQQGALMQLIEEYVGRYREPFSEDDLQKIREAGVGKIHFFWSGGAARGEPVYYRIHGPTFVMEYANVQNGANHSHTVWRDFENDFGYDALEHHLEAEH
ncbi:DUF3500 domain-containing protein [Coraliomargarita sinensis]|nr:DUF3500 domain-containing protein [Coraliomargarita sinensis]